MDAKNPEIESFAREPDEFGIRDLVVGIWDSRVWALAGLLIVALAAVAVTLTMHILMPSTATYRQEVAFTLPAQYDGHYPNGTVFSPSDLRSPAVLQRVYEETGLAEYGLIYPDFAAAVTVIPTSALYEGVTARYRDRLADTRLTFEERRLIEAEFGAAIGTTLSASAVVSLTLPGELGVPRALGRHVVAAIPNVWADIYINQLNVIDFPVPGSTVELISADFVEALDYPIAYDALTAAFADLRARIDSIRQLSGAANLADPATGRTLYDIQRDVDRLDQFSLQQVLAPLTEMGLTKSGELTIAVYRYRIDEIDRQIRLARENARIIDTVLRAVDSDATGAGAEAAALASSQPQQGVPATIVQQFGPELVDRLIGMSVENAGIAFRERMLEEKWRYESQALRYTVQKDQIERRLTLLAGGGTAGDTLAAMADIFNAETGRLVAELNGLWSQIENILAQANLQRLNYDKQLFRPVPTLNAVETGTSVLLSRNTALTWIAAAALGLILGIGAYFLYGILRNRAA